MKHTVINLLSETETKAYVLPLFKDEAIPSESVLFGALSKTAKDYIQKVSKEATISVGSFQKIVLPGDEAGVVLVFQVEGDLGLFDDAQDVQDIFGVEADEHLSALVADGQFFSGGAQFCGVGQESQVPVAHFEPHHF